jgi:hypothetical protein
MACHPWPRLAQPSLGQGLAWLGSGGGAQVTFRPCGPCFFFFQKIYSKGLAFGEGASTAPHFLKLAPILGRVKSSIFHGARRFYFFPNFIFAKFRIHLD